MERPNLSDPECEPTDEQFAELLRQAFAGIADRQREVLRALHETIAREGRDAVRKWQERGSCSPS
jgi:hypothetical protein